MEPAGLHSINAPDGRLVHYETGGGPAATTNQPTVVFLHGTLANRFAFRKVRPFLEPAQRTLLTVLRGHGDDEERTLPPDYSLAGTEVDDLVAVLDAATDGPVDLFAHSTGGSIAVALAYRHPERIRRMVLVEPTLLPLLPILDRAMADRVAADTAAMVETAHRGDHVAALQLLLDFIGGTAWHGSEPAARQRVLDNLSPLAPLTGPHAAALAGLAVTADQVAAIPHPTLAIYGRESAYFEATIAAVLAQLRPDIPQVHVDGSGHNSHLERPELVGPTAAEFLGAT